MENSTKNKSKIIDSAPGFLKEILPYISSRIFDLMDIPLVAMNMGKLSYQYLFSKGVSDLKSTLEGNLPQGISFGSYSGEPKSNQEIGEALLELYFYQVLSGEKVFLDLRPSCFEKIDGGLSWTPNGLHCQLDNKFQEGLSELYEGFYGNNNPLYEKGLLKIGLLNEGDSAEVKQEMMNIFNNHFGEGDQESVRFEMKHFTDSFHQVFDKIFHQNKKLSEDFVYLGMYLVTLYLHLEKLDTSLNVRKAFQKARSRLSA